MMRKGNDMTDFCKADTGYEISMTIRAITDAMVLEGWALNKTPNYAKAAGYLEGLVCTLATSQGEKAAQRILEDLRRRKAEVEARLEETRAQTVA